MINFFQTEIVSDRKDCLNSPLCKGKPLTDNCQQYVIQAQKIMEKKTPLTKCHRNIIARVDKC